MADKVEVSGGGGWIAIALIIIATWNDPETHTDLVDATIHYLVSQTPEDQRHVPYAEREESDDQS